MEIDRYNESLAFSLRRTHPIECATHNGIWDWLTITGYIFIDTEHTSSCI